ncbi:hypothetical protein WMF18_23840 [Sorangium sp. So ce315]|uniref:hypothetical protein n=1 Tax=Sorangium sp. So ce315 TaxID=3133299 RepID=UPI003F62EF8D
MSARARSRSAAALVARGAAVVVPAGRSGTVLNWIDEGSPGPRERDGAILGLRLQ